MAQRPVDERVEETPAAAPDRRGRDRRRHVLPDIWWDVESREIVFIVLDIGTRPVGRVFCVVCGSRKGGFRTPYKSPCPTKTGSGHRGNRRARKRGFPSLIPELVGEYSQYRLLQQTPFL